MARSLLVLVIIAVAIGGYFAFRQAESKTNLYFPNSEVDTDNLTFSNWKRYTEPSGRFTVTLPSLPQHATESITDPKTKQKRHYEMYMSPKSEGSVFLVNLVTLHDVDSTQKETELLNDYMNELLAKNSKNELKDLTSGEFNGHKTMNFTIHNEDVDVINRIFLKDKTIYVLAEIQKGQRADNKDYEYFINSFQLNNTKAIAKPESVPDTTSTNVPNTTTK